MLRAHQLRRFDWILLSAALTLSLLGIAMLWGIAHAADKWHILPRRQFQWLVISLIVVISVIVIDYKLWARLAYVLFGLTLIALALLPAFGEEINRSVRWFHLGPISVQPSEFAKLAFILALARYLMYRKNYRTFRGLIPPFLMAAVPMALILIQPDLGTALLFLPTLFVMLYVAGASPKHLGIVAVGGIGCLPLLWQFMGVAQRSRILGFLDPAKDPFGAGWHVTRSTAATIAGGITGAGFSSGAPILQHQGFKAFNDFIFSAVAHEFGFIGAIGVLIIFLIFFTRGAQIAARTRDPFGRLVAVGALTLLAMQTLVNIGMTIRLCPITGMTLPFVSQGGSSLLICLVIVGLLINIGMRQRPTVAPEDFA